jgi:hypothetical protein
VRQAIRLALVADVRRKIVRNLLGVSLSKHVKTLQLDVKHILQDVEGGIFGCAASCRYGPTVDRSTLATAG